jgi:hypothetical protein
MMMQQPGGMGNRMTGGTMGRAMPGMGGSMGGGMGGSRLPDPYHSPFMGMPQGQMPNFSPGGMGGGMRQRPPTPQPPGLGWGAGGMGGGMNGNTGFNPGAAQDFLKQIQSGEGMGYLGGSQTFDESTGQYRTPGAGLEKLRSVWG